jgi:hypothetical protein
VKPTTANFDAEYAPKCMFGTQPAIDAKLISEPCLRASRRGNTAFATFTTPP